MVYDPGKIFGQSNWIYSVLAHVHEETTVEDAIERSPTTGKLVV